MLSFVTALTGARRRLLVARIRASERAVSWAITGPRNTKEVVNLPATSPALLRPQSEREEEIKEEDGRVSASAQSTTGVTARRIGVIDLIRSTRTRARTEHVAALQTDASAAMRCTHREEDKCNCELLLFTSGLDYMRLLGQWNSVK